MPITLKTGNIKVKENDEFIPLDALKGDNGDPTSIIDDTAGEGDTNKVYSADKVASEFSQYNSALNVSQPSAQQSDIGKALILKTIDQDGKPTGFEYGEAGGGGTSDYTDLTNKPQINGVTLSGNKTSSDLGLPTTADIESAVDDWLDENITNPDSPPLDRSLSSASSAAPADIVGKQDAAMPQHTRTPVLAFTSKKTWIDNNGVAVFTDNSTSNYRASNAVEVRPREDVTLTFVASKHGNSSNHTLIVTDSEYNILQSYDDTAANLGTVTLSFTVPPTGKYFMINQWASAQPTDFTITYYYEVAKKEYVDEFNTRINNLEDNDFKWMPRVSATPNILDYTKTREGSINAETGVFTPASATYKWIVVGPSYVDPGKTYYCDPYVRGYYFYDKSGKFLRGWTGSGMAEYVQQLTIPQDAQYVSLFFYIAKSASEAGVTIQEYVRDTVCVSEYGYDRTSGYGLVKHTFEPINKLDIDNRTDFYVDTRRLKGKSIAILGDSIGTRDGYNDPEILIGEDDVGVELSAYVTNNDVVAGLSIAGTTYTSSDIGTEVTFTPTAEDIGKSIGVPLNHGNAAGVKWWQLLAEKFGMKATNASWSGATMVSMESETTTAYKASCAWYVPAIRRCGFRTPGTMTRTAPDYIFIHRGVNDFSTAHAGHHTVLTDDIFAAHNYTIPQTDEITVNNATKYDFKQAYAMTIQKLRDAYPTAKIICCTLAPFRRHNETHFPPDNGYYSLPQFNAAIREVAAFFNCPVCEFAEAYSYENLSYYSGDNTHPNSYGHRAMYEKALLCLANNMKFEG